MARAGRFEDWILKEDDNYIIINKPPQLSTLEDRASNLNVLKLAKAYYSEAQVCHRLDKETSGVMAIAKNPEAYRHASMQFENRKAEKKYHAIADGIHNFKDFRVEAAIQILGKGKVKISNLRGKDSTTILNTIEVYKAHSLIECKPVSGRMHQIRIHLSASGAPITGDEMYGGTPFFLSSIKRKYNLKNDTEEQPLIARLALHAQSLKFEGLGGDIIDIEAPYPKDFRVLVQQLTKNK